MRPDATATLSDLVVTLLSPASRCRKTSKINLP